MMNIGKRGPKPKYNGISCPNETYFFYGKIGEGNITSRGTWTNATGEVVLVELRASGPGIADVTEQVDLIRFVEDGRGGDHHSLRGDAGDEDDVGVWHIHPTLIV